MSFMSLSTELILQISSYLHQVDLLNISLVCQRLRDVTEPELFREYTNTKINGRSFLPFIRKLLKSPELRKYVRKLELRIWETVEHLNPRYYEIINGPPNKARSKAEFDKQCIEVSKDDYFLFTEAAKANGCIVDIFPYERKSFVIKEARKLLYQDIDNEFWSYYVFDRHVHYSALPYDRIFCQMLRAGLEEPLVALLVALLPMVKEILLYGVPGEPTALRWRANHGFKNLRTVVASGYDSEGLFPIAFFNSIFAAGTLESFKALATSSWSIDPGTHAPDTLEEQPLSLQPRSLNLKVIELRSSILTSSELRSLLEACCEIKMFGYTSTNLPTETKKVTPLEMIELLRPFQKSLEELVLSFDDDDYEEFGQDDFIYSVKHMTSLKHLSVPPECWWATIIGEYEDAEDEAPNRMYGRGLSGRLPPSLETLSLPLSNAQEHTAVEQVEDIILHRAEALPHLSALYIGADEDDELYFDDFEQMMDSIENFMNDSPQDLTVSIGGEQWRSVFNTLVPSRKQPFMRWFGNKYAHRRRKPNRFEKTMQLVTDRYKNQDLSDVERLEKYRNDPDFQAVCADNTSGPGKNKEEEQIEYYSQDEEDWSNYSYLDVVKQEIINRNEDDFSD